MNTKEMIEAVVEGEDPRETHAVALNEAAMSPQVLKPLKSLGIKYDKQIDRKDFRSFNLTFDGTQSRELGKRLKTAGYRKVGNQYTKVIGKDSVTFLLSARVGSVTLDKGSARKPTPGIASPGSGRTEPTRVLGVPLKKRAKKAPPTLPANAPEFQALLGTRIGRVTGNIPGDYRYADAVDVKVLLNGKVEITTRKSGAVGGMDSFLGSTSNEGAYKDLINTPTAKKIIQSIKAAYSSKNNLIRVYGKPTKNFTWVFGGVRIKGLSAGVPYLKGYFG